MEYCDQCGEEEPWCICDDDGGCWEEEDEHERWGCYFPGECCMPGPHMLSECHTPEMIEAWMQEQEEGDA